MRIVGVWIAAMMFSFIVIFSYIMFAPIYHRFNETYTEHVNFTSATVQTTSDQLTQYAGSGMRLFLYLFLGIIIVATYASSQRREEYSGYYG